MRIVVTGDFREPVLLDTDKATGLLILSDEGRPNVVYRVIANGKAWVRYTKGEDAEFDSVVKALGLVK
jgi:hypothetical protein